MNSITETTYKKHQEEAVKLFNNGYNCAQAILVAYKDKTNMDINFSLKISSALGGGIAVTSRICGTINAAVMIIGIVYGNTDSLDTKRKIRVKEVTRNFINDFTASHNGINCAELLLEDKNKKHTTHSKKCISIIKEVCDLLDKHLEVK